MLQSRFIFSSMMFLLLTVEKPLATEVLTDPHRDDAISNALRVLGPMMEGLGAAEEDFLQLAPTLETAGENFRSLPMGDFFDAGPLLIETDIVGGGYIPLIFLRWRKRTKFLIG